jgi:NAD(P)-dependent dehydrogenase (short-subunit alcohol dehydrogenase family)
VDVKHGSVLVTGGSGGIGAGIARAFAAAGTRDLRLLARDRGALERLAAELGRASVLPCDLTDAAGVERALLGVDHVDVLVHAAGANVPQPLAELDLGIADRLWALNVRAALHLCKLVVPRMHDGGAIVLISSQMGHVGAERRGAYCATKHAVEGLVKALALELAPRGIRVVSIAPTFVATPMTAPFFDEPGFRDQVLAQIPLGRLATVEEVAAATVFAASAQAAMITGSSIRVDGGWTAR